VHFTVMFDDCDNSELLTCLGMENN